MKYFALQFTKNTSNLTDTTKQSFKRTRTNTINNNKLSLGPNSANTNKRVVWKFMDGEKWSRNGQTGWTHKHVPKQSHQVCKSHILRGKTDSLLSFMMKSFSISPLALSCRRYFHQQKNQENTGSFHLENKNESINRCLNVCCTKK